MKKSIWIFLGSMMAMVWLMMGNNDGTTPSGSGKPHPVMQQKLETSILMAKANVECGYSSSGGYAHYTSEQAAKKLVETMNASLIRLPGEPKVPGPLISYALNKASKPWQIVVRNDSKNKQLIFEAYGSNITQAVITDKIPCAS